VDKTSKIYLTGHSGLVHCAATNSAPILEFAFAPASGSLDLTNQREVQGFAEERPEYVFLAAAKVRGILANDTYPGDFLVRIF